MPAALAPVYRQLRKAFGDGKHRDDEQHRDHGVYVDARSGQDAAPLNKVVATVSSHAAWRSIGKPMRIQVSNRSSASSTQMPGVDAYREDDGENAEPFRAASSRTAAYETRETNTRDEQRAGRHATRGRGTAGAAVILQRVRISRLTGRRGEPTSSGSGRLPAATSQLRGRAPS